MPARVNYPWRGDRAAVIARVRELHRLGVDVAHQAMRDAKGERSAIVEHAKRDFGLPWPEVLAEAGGEPRRQRWSWSENGAALVARVRELKEQGVAVSSNKMRDGAREHRALFRHATNVLGLKWRDVLSQVNALPKRGSWHWRGDGRAVIARVRELHGQGVDVTRYSMYKSGVAEHRALVGHATKSLGLDWADVLKQVGAVPKRRNWSWLGKPDALIARVRQLHSKGVNVSSKAMQRGLPEHRLLVSHSRKLLGIPWSAVLAQAGVPRKGGRNSAVNLALGLQGLLREEGGG